MKNLVVAGSFLLLFAACSSKEDKMKEDIKKYMDENGKDPKSYKFMKLTIEDTVTVGKVAARLIEVNAKGNADFRDNLADCQRELAYRNEYKRPAFYSDQSDEKLKESIRIGKEYLLANAADSIKHVSKINDKTIAGYVASHRYRIRNGLGVLDIEEQYFPFDVEGNLLDAPSKRIDYGLFAQLLEKEGVL